MSYFVCNHGEKYFPFGKGGRDNLLRGLQMSALGTTTAAAASTSTFAGTERNTEVVVNKAMQRLNECPLHALPLSHTVSSTFYSPPSPSTNATANAPSTGGGLDEIESIYSAIADDAILEIYKLKMSQKMVPMISYLESSDEIILRDISVDSAVEHRVPAIELRVRDPVTGR